MLFRQSLSRRTVLRGLGATLALPALDAMIPALPARGRDGATPPHRLGVLYVPNGMAMHAWTPTGTGRAYELSSTLSPLASFRDDVVVVSGLNSLPSPGRPGGTHAKASTRFLTNVSPPTSLTVIDAGVSLDQIVARDIGRDTMLASMELAVEAADTAGACDVGFACPYTNTISWRSANTPLPMENNPRIVFERMFGDSGSTDPKARLARIRQKRSILDSAIQELGRLQRGLIPGDRAKLAEYLDAVRDVERRIQMAESHSRQQVPSMHQPGGAPAVYGEHVELMFDLMVVAFQADLTRVVTFMLGREFSGLTYPHLGVTDAHHPLSHHGGDVTKLDKLARVNRYHVSLFARLLDKLRSTPDGEGSLLDHVTMMYGTGMSESNTHDTRNVPLVLAGGANGQLKGGHHLKANGEPLADLHMALLQKMDVACDGIGDSRGVLSGL